MDLRRKLFWVSVLYFAEGFPFGIYDNVEYDEWSMILNPGDILVFHSDGLSEAFDADGNLFGVRRLRTILETHASMTAGEIADEMLAAVEKFTQGAEVTDDRTLVVMKVL